METIQRGRIIQATSGFDQITLKLASPERVLEWSFGEITKPETINYRTQRSERGGLFDERIFGPEKDYECYCGKYRRIRFKDIICEKCGVEVTRSIVRRERMGHIELSSPVAHIWFVRGVPSRMGLLLGLSTIDLEKVIYFAGYIITKINEDERKNILEALDHEFKTKTKAAGSDEEKEKIKASLSEVKKEISSLQRGKVLDEILYHKYSIKYSSIFEAQIGAEAIYKIVKNIDLQKLGDELEKRLPEVGAAERPKVLRRLSMVRAMVRSKVRPEWMFLKNVPVIPPALRPMVALDGGRHATSDLNDLYRRVINRNNRLKKLKDLGAPEVIQRNEKRILQEAVDALIDNSIRRGGEQGAISSAQRRPLKSLADILRGKPGRFRQNLLGKRVDYSGRSVIVVGPQLKLSECGLPKHMALELFRPFVVGKLLEREMAFNIRGAGKLIEEGVPEVWEILEEVIRDKYVLLNRAPTLHRLGIQAFQPILIEGNAIQIHPLVCPAFNADFDGDQMAVHVPLGDKAQSEARELMAANKNLLKPGTGDPIVTPKQDMVLGCYWMTKQIDGEIGEGGIYGSPNAAILAYDYGVLAFRARIKVLGTEKSKYEAWAGVLYETTVGRILFNSVLPDDFPFINKELTAKELSALTEELIAKYGTDAMADILDKIKHFSFKYVTKSGITCSIADIIVPKEKGELVAQARKKVEELEHHFENGFISEAERYRMVIEIWRGVRDRLEIISPEQLSEGSGIKDMLLSRARGTISHLTQMAGMKGLIVNPHGEVIDFPIVPSYKEGLSPLEYFITSHGSRKGLTDTALNTAKSGYLARKLVDVAQSMIVREEDCSDKDGKWVARAELVGFDTISSAVRGRVLAKTINDPETGKPLYKRGELIMKRDAEILDGKGVGEVYIRSPLSCKTRLGVCRQCYGLDMGRDKIVAMGEAVGVIAAQSIGEPATQLTMRTFHSGGVASEGGDITMGLPRVEEIFERRNPKAEAVLSVTKGTVMEIRDDGKDKKVKILSDKDSKLTVKRGKKGARRETDGDTVEYEIPYSRQIVVREGQDINAGDFITNGSANLQDLFAYGGRSKVEDYILSEVNKIYALQGAAISRKHIEVIIRQMFSRHRVLDGGDTTLVIGSIAEVEEIDRENDLVKVGGGKEASTMPLIMGISEVALTTQSFLSAASFQHTGRILIETAIKGGVDYLRGLKENVIVGRLIPAGTGYREHLEDMREDSEEDVSE
ncbi:MAG: DNA-directed RNA polymerase subunit beta' [Candidatus Vogelbacteria bacterium CG10_big_fil_rev_8_21_14_0_10_45_14]|uniref:DNA-directed RNA polymerase subunit beta' n=1 Tax=Candidatus Vogelbacteria bacterium CG10_big_fil_rev_8_21_14_0_10_45_14 TaxID=1975042 RepID=A0A2H0RJZ5_9BACT|nr:MAG: DNA-directed RNA polymerase subunit beta' [Candidatus Vogelbacteria bacterium CG10_big_fil_rev_8_21_14_0_10_45_14]